MFHHVYCVSVFVFIRLFEQTLKFLQVFIYIARLSSTMTDNDIKKAVGAI